MKLPVTWPHAVKVGAVTVKIYKVEERGRVRFAVSYHDASGRKLVRRDSFEDAKREAELVAGKLASGQGAVLELKSNDRDAYVEAMRLLRPTGLPLHVAIAEFIAARKVLPDGVTLATAAEDYAGRHRGSQGDKTVAEVVAAFLADRKPEVSDRHFADLTVQLAPLPAERKPRASKTKRMQPFADRFKVSIRSITAGDIDAWLKSIGGAGKRSNNIRSSVVSLFRYAQRLGYVPRDLKTEAEMSGRKKVDETPKEIYSPDEFTKLAEMQDEEARLYALIGGLAGLRPSELLRLEWRHIHFETGYIEVNTEGKTGQRLTPLLPSLALWLAPYKGCKGPIFTREGSDNIFLKHANRLLGELPDNGLRHSYITFRLAEVKSMAQVAEEAGTSAEKIRKHYKALRTRDGRLVTESLAKAFFSVAPNIPSNVLSIRAES